MRKLAAFASDVFRSKTLFPNASLRAEYDLNNFAKNVLTSLSPFIEYYSNRLKWRFIHPFLVEVLCAWDLKCCFQERKVFPNNSQIEKSGSAYVTIIRLLGGFSLDETDKDKNLAIRIVEMIKSLGIANDDLLVWLSLLREGSWSPSLRKIVKNELKSKTSWSVPHANPREVEGVVYMVDHRVFLPREVIIEADAPVEVVQMLASHSNINVRIYPRVCRIPRPRDVLLEALQGAGNVVEFQGKLEERGTRALAYMTRFRTLELHITSLTALHAFSVSVKKLLVLDDLQLHLALPFDTPPSRVPRVVVVPRRVIVYLTLYSITDTTCGWAVEVCKMLRCHKDRKTKVYLKKSALSPDKLQLIKTELHPSDIHISQS